MTGMEKRESTLVVVDNDDTRNPGSFCSAETTANERVKKVFSSSLNNLIDQQSCDSAKDEFFFLSSLLKMQLLKNCHCNGLCPGAQWSRSATGKKATKCLMDDLKSTAGCCCSWHFTAGVTTLKYSSTYNASVTVPLENDQTVSRSTWS